MKRITVTLTEDEIRHLSVIELYWRESLKGGLQPETIAFSRRLGNKLYKLTRAKS